MKRAVLSLIRFVGAALVIFGLLGLGLEYAHQKISGLRWSELFLGGGLIIAGISLLAGSAKLADKLTDDLED